MVKWNPEKSCLISSKHNSSPLPLFGQNKKHQIEQVYVSETCQSVDKKGVIVWGNWRAGWCKAQLTETNHHFQVWTVKVFSDENPSASMHLQGNGGNESLFQLWVVCLWSSFLFSCYILDYFYVWSVLVCEVLWWPIVCGPMGRTGAGTAQLPKPELPPRSNIICLLLLFKGTSLPYEPFINVYRIRRNTTE